MQKFKTTRPDEETLRTQIAEAASFARSAEQHSVNAGASFIKSALTLNGAAAIALIGLADKVEKISGAQASDLALPVSLFVAGALSALVAHGSAYFADNYTSAFRWNDFDLYSLLAIGRSDKSKDISNTREKNVHLHRKWVIAAITFSLFSALFFVAGATLSVVLLLTNPEKKNLGTWVSAQPSHSQIHTRATTVML